jgi:hypothetical protein
VCAALDDWCVKDHRFVEYSSHCPIINVLSVSDAFVIIETTAPKSIPGNCRQALAIMSAFVVLHVAKNSFHDKAICRHLLALRLNEVAP